MATTEFESEAQDMREREREREKCEGVTHHFIDDWTANNFTWKHSQRDDLVGEREMERERRVDANPC